MCLRAHLRLRLGVVSEYLSLHIEGNDRKYISTWSGIPKETMANDKSWGGVTVDDSITMVTIACTLSSMPTDAREPTNAVWMAIKETICHLS